MNQPDSIAAASRTQPEPDVQAARPTVWLAFCGALMVIAVAVMLADAALTPEQRMAVFMQTGSFP